MAAILLVAPVALTLNLSRLGARSLLGDEAIYATIARETAVHGSWYPLRFTGLDPALPAVAVLLAAGFGEIARGLATSGDQPSRLTPRQRLLDRGGER